MSACGCKAAKKESCKCNQGVKTMEKAEMIAALVTDKFSGFKEGDEAVLETCSDARLEEFRSASAARQVDAGRYTKLESEHRNTTARLKVAEDRIKALEAPLSEEDFRARAPEHIKQILEERAADESTYRASLISGLKDLGVKTEEELKKASTEDLETLAAFARVEVPDFSGRGLPKERRDAADRATVNYAPPDPYKAGIDAMQQSARR